MTNNTTQTQNNDIIQDVYAALPAALHEHVQEAWLYHGADLESGTITVQEFIAHVQNFASSAEDTKSRQDRNVELMEGVRQLVASNKIEQADFAQELLKQLDQGENSQLFRFIVTQDLINPLDAAVSFLAWKHARALAQLEDAFGVDLQAFRALQPDELLDTSESGMTALNFSVHAQ